MVLMLTEKFEIDKLLIEKSMRKTNSCYERHKFCTLLDIYFDLKCNKAWVKEEAGFLDIFIFITTRPVSNLSLLFLQPNILIFLSIRKFSGHLTQFVNIIIWDTFISWNGLPSFSHELKFDKLEGAFPQF